MEILGIHAAADFLGVPVTSMRYWRTSGVGPASFKVGRRVAYRRTELERWMREQEAATSRGGQAAG